MLEQHRLGQRSGMSPEQMASVQAMRVRRADERRELPLRAGCGKRRSATITCVRVLSPFCAAVHVGLVGVTAFFVLALASVPLENPREELVAVRPWLAVAGYLLAALAFVFAGAAFVRNVRLVTAAWLLNSLVTGALLFYVLTVDLTEWFKAQLALGAFAILVTGGIVANWTAEGQT
jgi:hypothetical protein